MGKLTVEASGKTDPEDPPPYPLEPLPTYKPGLQTNIVVPEAEPGQPPARPRRCPKKCGTIVLVTVCVVLVVAVVMLGIKLGKKHMMAGKHGCRDRGEEGRMGDDDCEEMGDMDEMGDEEPQSDEQDGDADEQNPNSRWCPGGTGSHNC
ncbi:uncharacterized protein LOC118414851 isoform X2 [Branchiostoma floridae]|uniref:Uncharacterized protein LOC118414851 isoform X2 n=1 Tax=Branchiostoma floridae TaxID=7739 RepID=A0A9J7L2N8_BRAFL|nr:uncharacterized protein LOC118414851 isoform X2 [Branchiostoma floridae]